MDTKLENLIMKALDYYDQQNSENKKYISDDTDITFQRSKEFSHDSDQVGDYEPKIYFQNKKQNMIENYLYEILGIFDNKTNIWVWSWVFPLIDNRLNQECKNLLKYGLNINIKNVESMDSYFIKTQLTNSRIYFKDKFQLDILIAVCSYLLGSKIKFIKEYKRKLNDDHYITYYYLLK